MNKKTSKAVGDPRVAKLVALIRAQQAEARRRREPQVVEEWLAHLTVVSAVAHSVIIGPLGAVPSSVVHEALAEVYGKQEAA